MQNWPVAVRIPLGVIGSLLISFGGSAVIYLTTSRHGSWMSVVWKGLLFFGLTWLLFAIKVAWFSYRHRSR